MKCHNCQYLIETYVETSCPFYIILLKILMFLVFLAVAPLIFAFVLLISLCLRSDIYLNMKRTFNNIFIHIFSWASIHTCPKCKIVIAESINYNS